MTGATGRHIIDPAPLISIEQAAADRAYFMQMAAREKKPEPSKAQIRREQLSNKRKEFAAKIDRAEQLREQGTPDTRIATLVGIAPKTITKYLGPTGAKCAPLPEAERKLKQRTARMMRQQGASFAEIGRVLGVTKQGVRLWFQDDGVAA